MQVDVPMRTAILAVTETVKDIYRKSVGVQAQKSADDLVLPRKELLQALAKALHVAPGREAVPSQALARKQTPSAPVNRRIVILIK